MNKTWFCSHNIFFFTNRQQHGQQHEGLKKYRDFFIEQRLNLELFAMACAILLFDWHIATIKAHYCHKRLAPSAAGRSVHHVIP